MNEFSEVFLYFTSYPPSLKKEKEKKEDQISVVLLIPPHKQYCTVTCKSYGGYHL